MPPTLLVTHTVPPETTVDLLAALEAELPADARVLSATTPEETDKHLPDADALVTGRLSSELLDKAENLQWVQALSAGVDSYPQAELEARDIALTNASGVHAEPIGEQVFGAMLSFERRFLESQANKDRGSWERVEGGELREKTLGIVGVGAIGSRVAELGQAFGMTVLGTKRDPSTMPAAVDVAFEDDEYPELCRRSDYLVLACPLTEETEGLLGMDEFRQMPGDAVLVNVARGEVVDEEALVRALQHGVIRGAALDVFETEPLPQDSPLWRLSNVLLTPHMAGSTPHKAGRWAGIIAENYRRFDTDEAFVNRVC
jgi:phosphoglycerate dehydrogenase-like enzyme